jgi:YjbE family integral membrane protein
MDIMGLTIAEFISQLLGIVLVDLVLGGDNAIVIGLACRNLPKNVRMKGVVLGTIGAVLFRGAATLLVVWLLGIKYLMLVGGVLLIFIGCKLMVKEDEDGEVKASSTLLRAILTVIAADAIMGIDNVLAVAGVAQGHGTMVLIGLAISIPIMVLGSTIIMRIMDRFPVVVYIGAVVILYAAGRMIVDDESLKPFFEANPVLHWALIVAIAAGGLAFGLLYNNYKKKRKAGQERTEP